MKKTCKIYVAGHRGLVGSAILRQLQDQGFVNFITRKHSELDLIRQEAVEKFFAEEQPDYVFLAAAKVGGIYANATYPAEFIYNNLAIEANVIHASYETGVKGLLFLGSSCVYPKLAPQPIKEEYLLTGPLEPTNTPYAIAKIAGIDLCESYNSKDGTRFLSVMPNNIYGPNDKFDLLDSHVLPGLIRKFHLAKLASEGDWDAIERDQLRFGKIPEDVMTGLKEKGGPVIKLWGTGKPLREFLYSDDLADACVFLMKHIEDIFSSSVFLSQGRHLINVGSGREITIKELADLIGNAVGFRGKVEWDLEKPDGTPRKFVDIGRITSLGWRAKIDLEAGLDLAYKDYWERSA